MSFLSRKPARPEGRGRDDEYDDYDDYAPDGYQSEDDGWSPGQYFSPEGIKGKWAGEHPDGRSGGRGRRDGDQGDAGYDSYGNDFNGAEYGGSAGYGADEFATGMYDLPDGADEDRADRGRRRRSRDREDRGERTGILRLRRDRGEDIWPDDGISDEDYWASVAADRPLNGTDSPLDNVPPAGGANSRLAADSRPGADPRPGMSGADSRFGGDQRGGERGVTGRLGPPPGLAADYKPGSGAPGGPGAAVPGRPQPARRQRPDGQRPHASAPGNRPASHQARDRPHPHRRGHRLPAARRADRHAARRVPAGTRLKLISAARPAALIPADERLPARRSAGQRPAAGPQRLG